MNIVMMNKILNFIYKIDNNIKIYFKLYIIYILYEYTY